MRFIIDAQLPPALASFLSGMGHDAFAVRDLGLHDADDRAIWDRAREMDAVIVTKDEDFVQLVNLSASGPAVVWVRIGNTVNRVLIARIETAWNEVESHLAGGARLVELR